MTTETTAPTYLPTFDRIIVRRDKAVEKIGSIELPKEAREKPYTGTVLSAGWKVERVKAGDRVVFAAFGGMEMPGDDEDVLVMREDDVMAIVVEQLG